MRKAKSLQYTFLIICEGENTDPSFFKSIVDNIIDGVFVIEPYRENIKITIRPEPKVEEEDINLMLKKSEHKYESKKRALKVKENIESFPVPLNFVKQGKSELEDGAFNEVWVVFDHDNHPARKEAFEESEKLINSKKINIAFSSISFEYFLLLHFEKINKVFLKSECREGRELNRKPFNCSLGEHPNDCNGENCIGGYSRKNQYWMNTKESKSAFNLVKDNLELGFINASWLRFVSQIESKSLPIYERNPYTTTDLLVKRLTGKDNYIYCWIAVGEISKVENLEILIKQNNVLIKNISNDSTVINEKSFSQRGNLIQDNFGFGERVVLTPGQEIQVRLEDKNSSMEYLFLHNKYKIYFELKDVYNSK